MGETVSIGSPFFDFTPFMDDDFEQERPSIGSVDGGGSIFYGGRLNEVHAEPSVGKSNIGLAVAVEVISSGKNAVHIDPEDTPRATFNKLLSFGAERGDIIKHFKYLHNPTGKDILESIDWVIEYGAETVAIDGLAELLAGQGLSENEPADVLSFFRDYIRPFTDTGAGVIISDHVVKSSENRGRWSRGTGAKMGRYDGAVYEVRMVEPYGPDKAGRVKMVVAKDRNGGVGPIGHVACEVTFTPRGGGFTEIRFVEPDNTKFQPTYYMEQVSRAVENDPEITLNGLRSIGKAKYVDQAIETLANIGNMQIVRGGIGKPNKYVVLAPYREKKA